MRDCEVRHSFCVPQPWMDPIGSPSNLPYFFSFALELMMISYCCKHIAGWIYMNTYSYIPVSIVVLQFFHLLLLWSLTRCVWVLDVFFLLLLHDAICHIVLYCEWEKNNRARDQMVCSSLCSFQSQFYTCKWGILD